MKKKKISGLFLNKKTISKLNSAKITGGFDSPTKGGICPVKSERGPCFSGECGPVTDPTLAPTCADGCTRNTIELSYCAGITIPDPCLSVQVCA